MYKFALLLGALAAVHGRHIPDTRCPSSETHHLLPHEYDCTKFYYCEYGLRWETPRDCAPGTEFSYDQQVCVHPAEANCTLPGGPPSPTTESPPTGETTPSTTTTTSAPPPGPGCPTLPNGCPVDFDVHWLVPHENDCTRFYYCVAGEKVERECPDGLHFNFALQVCDWPSTAGCVTDPGSSPAPPPDCDSPTGCETTPSTTTTTSAPPPGPGCPTLPNGCPVDFDVHWLVPHENDCTRFYYCVAGEKVERECPDGLHFNFALQVCDWPSTAGCVTDPGSSPAPPPDCDSPTGCETTPSTTTTTSAPPPGPGCPTLPNGCPVDFDVHWLVPHENDCTRFYYCVFGEKVERECPDGLHFNFALQVCDWPSTAGCVTDPGSSPAPPPDCDSPTGCETTPSTTTTTGAPPPGPGCPTLPNGCPVDFDVHWLVPHENDCTRFYYCVFGEKVERECPDGLHFNFALQVCDWPLTAGCVTDPGSSPAPPPDCDSPTGCETTPSTTTTTSAPPPGPGCPTLPNGCPVDFDVHWLVPHENDCTRFYYCVFGEKVERECPDGLHFNFALQVCDWPSTAGCVTDPGSSPAPPPDCDSPTGCETTPSTTTTTGAPPPGPGCPTLPNGCPVDFDVHWLVPHENDCTRFYYCVFGEKVERECPDGLHFNFALQVCDWPSNAGCVTDPGSSPAPPPDCDSPTGCDTTPSTTTTSTTTTTAPPPGPGVTLPNGCPSDFDIHWLLPHENDCNKFYYCVFGEKVERECPDNLHFNPELQVCDWPADAGCESGSSPSPPPDCGSSTTPGPGCETTPSTTTTSTTTTTTTTAPPPPGPGVTLPNGCPSDFDIHWLLPHEKDCNKFYYCVFGEKVERQCPDNLHFNPELQVCDWPADAGCESGSSPSPPPDCGSSTTPGPGCETTPSTTTTSTTTTTTTTAPPPPGPGVTLPNGCPSDFDIHWLLPHEKDCNKFYYCVFGEKVERQCPDNLHFNPELQVCDWPADAGCESGSSPSPPPDCGSSTTPGPGCETTPSTTTTSTTTTTTTSAPPPGPGCPTLPNGCPTDFDVHWLLPHEKDCNKFYYCVFGEKVERQCPDNLHFNPELQVCDWPADAGCESGSSPSPPPDCGSSTTPGPGCETTPSTTTTSTTTTTTTTAPPPPGPGVTLPNGCPSDFDIHWLLPHEKDCNKFYYCVFGEKVERQCPDNLHFNPELQVCDWPADAGCESGSSPAPPPDCGSTTTPGPGCETTPSTTTTSTTTTTTTTAPPPPGPGVTLPNGCPSDFDIHWLLPHEKDCNKFYYCVFGEKVERQCPDNLHFNPELQVCDWPADAGCESGSSPSPPPDCGSSTTPGPGCETTPSTTTTSTTTTTTTTAPPPPGPGVTLPNGCPSDFDIHWLLPHEKDCNKFYYCAFGEKVEGACPDNLHFNPELQVCDWPADAGCESGSSPSPPPDCGSSTTPGPGCETTPSTTTTSTTTTTTTSAPPPGPGCPTLPNGCPTDFDVHWLLPHEKDCNKFYYCVFGEKVERQCPDNLHFNSELQVCDWPADAGCESGSSPSPPPDCGSTTTPGPGCETTPSTTTTSTTTTTTTTAPPPPGPGVTLPNGCPSDFDIHWLLPHEKDCNKFYYCVFGEKVERQCPDNLHFNPELQVCDWPADAGCESGSSPSPPPDCGSTTTPGPGCETTPSTTTTSTTTTTTTSAPPPGPGCPTLPNGCPTDFDVHWLLPHEKDCNKFYYCVFGEKVERQCPDNLHFNPELQVCDWPADAGCESGSSPSPPPDCGSSTTPGPGCETTPSTTTTSTTTTTTTTLPPLPPSVCEANCNIGPWAHETDCDKFWKCVGDVVVVGVCSEGLQFNPETETCDFACNVDCVKSHVQVTKERDGVRIFLPRDKVGEHWLEYVRERIV